MGRKELCGTVSGYLTRGATVPDIEASLGWRSTGERDADGYPVVVRNPADDLFTVNGRHVPFDEFARVCREWGYPLADQIAALPDTATVSWDGEPPK